MKILNIGAVLAVSLMGSACVSLPAQATSTVCPSQLKVGQTFQAALETNASTGFQWQVHEQSNNLHVLSNPTQAASNTSKQPLVGAPSLQVWTFKAVAAGEAHVKLVYVRAWEADQVARQWECRVMVGV